ncbi:unnamed protein product [Somion occarium]|uniref:Vomeronasal type-1 receptor n=1 Tax=Somion occarium TaxID=3059160 RepID=A0ABP1CTJ7_9APHY
MHLSCPAYLCFSKESPDLTLRATRCLASVWIYELLYFSTQVTVLLVSALRIYVVFSLNFRLFTIILIPGLLLPCAHLSYTAISTRILVHDTTGTLNCFFLDTHGSATGAKEVETSCFTEFACDTFVIILLWTRTIQIYRMSSDARLNLSSVVRVLLRDGTIYFLAMVCLGIPLLLSTNREQPLSLLSGFGAAALDLSMALRSILVCRFMLNLREHHHGEQQQESNTDRSAMQFATYIMGPLSAPIVPPIRSESYAMTPL